MLKIELSKLQDAMLKFNKIGVDEMAVWDGLILEIILNMGCQGFRCEGLCL